MVGLFVLVVLLVVGVLRVWTDLAPVSVLTLLDTVLLHHEVALLVRHLLTMLLVDRVAHLPRVRVALLY